MRKIRNILIGILAGCLFFSGMSVDVLAQEVVMGEETTSDGQEVPEDDDPGYGRLNGLVDPDFYEGNESGSISKAITHDSRFDGYTILQGIDVSKYQGTINWTKVKESGKVDFAIVRVGFRGSATGTLAEDSAYVTNIEGALKAGIPVGVYIFSQATTTKEAIEEAKYVLERIKDYNITLPVVMDYEYAYTSTGLGGKLYDAHLTKREATDNCLAFCEYVENAGYDAMIYANKSFLSDQMYADEVSENYQIWLANYTNKTTYTGDYNFWQYTDAGVVSGITENTVDMNYWYLNEEEIGRLKLWVTGSTTESVSLRWAQDTEASGYELYRAKENGESELIATIEGNETFTYTDSGLSSGTLYAYKIRPYYVTQNEITDETTGEIVTETTTEYGEFSKSKNGVTVVEKTTLSKGDAAFDAIKLTWKKVSGATGYQIQRYNSSTGKYTTIKTTTSSSTLSYKNTGLNASTTYKYRIRAYKTVGATTVYGKYSDVLSAKTNGSVKGKVISSSVYVRSGAGTSYKKLTTVKKNKVLTVTGSKGSWYRISITISGTKKTAYIKKDYVTLTTTTTSKPEKPILTVKATAFDKIKLSWEKVKDATGYQIQRYNSSTKKYVTVKTVTSASTVAYTNGSLNAATTYKYRIRAYKTLGSETVYSSYSSAKSTKTEAARTAKISASNVNVRKGAGTSYAVITTLKKGTKITVTGSSGSWYRVSITVSGKKKTGYVLKTYAELL